MVVSRKSKNKQMLVCPQNTPFLVVFQKRKSNIKRKNIKYIIIIYIIFYGGKIRLRI